MTKYSYDEALSSTMEFFDNDNFASTTFLNKYAMKDSEGNFLERNPNDTVKRVVDELAEHHYTKQITEESATRIFGKDYRGSKEWKEIFFAAWNKWKGVCPQGSVISASGNKESLQSLSNCFVIESPEDDLESIMKASENEGQLMKRRGGVGIDLSKLRPEGMPVANAARTSTGVPGWMNHFSNVCNTIGQNGRRGALMLTLDIKHPDAAGFAKAKQNLQYCTGANVSLKITDEFMEAVHEGKKFKQQYPVDSDTPSIMKLVDARELWGTICECAHKTAEPGLIMWDNAVNNLPAHNYPQFKSVSTNPCSEIILSENDACRLTTICLEGYVRNKFKEDSYFDFPSFKRDVRIAMHLMDALVSTEIAQIQKILKKVNKGSNEYNLWAKIQKAAIDGRRCGLGTHGLGDALCQLNHRYDSDEALVVIDKIYKTMMETAYDESVEMAKEAGSFPIYDYETEKDNIFIKRLPKALREKMKEVGRRNISILTNAPTGTISILSQVSSGIEPTFRQMYTRRRKINTNDQAATVDFVDELGVKWMEFPIFEKNVECYFREMGIKPPENVRNDDELSKHLSPHFITSDKIDWLRRVEVQATAQKYIDHSISSTINLPSTVTVDEVKKIYEHAHKKGLKGVTVYRDGCRSGVLVTKKEVNPDERPTSIQRTNSPKRPDKLPCEVHHTKVKGVDYVVVVGLLDGKVYEVFFGEYKNQTVPKKHLSGFLQKQRSGKYILNFIDDTELYQVDIMEYFPNEDYKAATRMVSMALRHGTPLEYVIEQLKKSSYSVAEFGSAMSRVLKKYIKLEDLQKSLMKEHGNENVKVVIEDGCVKIINLDTGLVESKCD